MTTWTSDELAKIGAPDELQIAGLRRDGSLRAPTTIWVVRVGDDLYVRSVREREADWFRGTHMRHEGQIRAGSVRKDVTFGYIADTERDIQDQIDAAYRAKYRRYAANIVNSVLTPAARAATLKLGPRGTDS